MNSTGPYRCSFAQGLATGLNLRLPPSTNSSIPVTKLESSDDRNNATLATSSGSPMRPIGTVTQSSNHVCRLPIRQRSVDRPGLTTFERYDGPSDLSPGSHERADGSLTRGVDNRKRSALNTRDRAVENDGATIISVAVRPFAP